MQLVGNHPLLIINRFHPSANFHTLCCNKFRLVNPFYIVIFFLYAATIAIIIHKIYSNMCIIIIIICRMTLYFFSRILSILLLYKTISFLMSRIKKLFHPFPFLSFFIAMPSLNVPTHRASLPSFNVFV